MTSHVSSNNPLETARSALADVSARTRRLTQELATIEAEIAALQRAPQRSERSLKELIARREEGKKAVRTARAAERDAKTAVRDELARWAGENPHDDARRLSAAYPIVFLPVRIETRFEVQQQHRREWRPNLMVRIYPDEIAGDTHEPGLTQAQFDAGVAFWKTAWNTAKESIAWRALVAAYPSQRAAWIVEQTKPTNLAARGTGEPTFNPLLTQQQNWSRAALTRVMPDRWIVLCYRGDKLVAEAPGAAVPDPLALSVDPAADPNDPNETGDISGHGLVLDHETAWTVDFQAALNAGMAIRVPLQPEDVSNGFDQVIVVGLKASLPPDAAAKSLTALFDSHHYTRGFAFLRQGTPTNNTSDARSGYPPDDTGGGHSFSIERGAPLNIAGGSGRLFTQALGLPDSLTEHIENSDLDEQSNARAMAEALWPCTFGYFLRQMMHPVFSQNDIDRAYAWFVERVRGRGPLPAFRIGGTPYGLLPVTALSRWRTGRQADALEQNLGLALRTLLKIWSDATPNVPRIGRSGDADNDLLTTLGIDASARRVWVRPALGPTAQYNIFSFFGIPWQQLGDLRSSIARQVLAAVGHPQWDPLVAWMSFDENADQFFGPLVAAVLSEDPNSLNPNYIQWIASAGISELKAEQMPFPKPGALLYYFLRHAALTEYSRIADLMLAAEGKVMVARPDEEMVGVGARRAQPLNAFERLNRRVPSTGSLTIAEYLVHPLRNTDKLGGWACRQTLGRLAGLSTAELERLFTETLDVCSHRIDAWVTSLASKRLSDMRSRVPLGCYLAAYGWVEDLKAMPADRVAIDRVEDGRTIFAQRDNGGFIHGPTMTHAATAAVLRNAYLARSGESAERYRIDLSSARVRKATWVLDAVRGGQQLGAVLGYQFERGLHEGHPGRELNKFIDVFRKLYPLVANKADDSGEPAEAVAARNVVDGLRLRDAWRASTVPFATDPGLAGASNEERAAIEDELWALDDTADAVADLLTAEGVFQIVRGNTAGASASLDSMAAGMRPPEPEIARQPRSGTSLTHRFGVILGSGLAVPAAWAAPASPRSTAEPSIDSWVGRLLGNPADVRCRVDYRDPLAGDPNRRSQKTISLDQLELRPIDFLAIAVTPSATGGASELDLRIVRAANLADDADVHIDHSSWADRSIRSFREIIEIATVIRDVIGGGRPLAPADLLPPENSADAKLVALEGGTRGADARTALGQLKADLTNAVNAIAATPENSAPDLTELRRQLMAASKFGIAGAFPSTFHASSKALRAELLDRGMTVLREVTRRHDDALTKTAQDEIASSVFGSGFVFLYQFTPAASGTLAQSLADSSALVGSPTAPDKWLQKTAPVRPPLQRWRRLTSYAQALGADPFALEVVQLPYAPGAPWVALPFADEAGRPPNGRISIVLHRAATPAANTSWAGIVLDEWSEVIPSEKEQTAIAFHYDDPGAEAAQAVLLAVPPAEQETWDFDTIVDTLRETLQLAKIRGTDLENVGILGQLIPAIFLASNPAGEAISTRLAAMLTEQPRMIAVTT